MGKRWLCMLLLLALMAGTATPAYGAEGLEAPPAAETMEEAHAPEEAPPAEEAAHTEEAPPAEEAVVTDEPEPAADQGVTVNLTGALEGLKYDVTYTSPDGSKTYAARSDGICWYDIDCKKHWIEHTDSRPTQFVMYPGGELKVKLNPGYDVAFENATVIEDWVDSWYGGGDAFFSTRYVTVKAPMSGTITVNVISNGSTANMSKLVDFTFYNNTPDIVVGGEDWGSSSPDMKTLEDGSVQWKVNTGGEFSEWAAPGYEIQVLEGGSVTKVCAPSGPAAQSVPAGAMSYVLHVDLCAERFVIAAVKKGDTFTPPAEDEEPATPEGVIFTDVPEGSWYENAVKSAYERGIVKGVTAHTFDPDGVTTRGQAVTMLYRAMGSPGGANVFSDTSGEVGSAAGWAASMGVTTGATEMKFAPNAYVTREQLVTMLYRLSGSPGMNTDEALRQYADGAAVQSYARDAVVWALSTGLLNGYTDMTIRPAGYATRAEVCALIMRYLGM